MRKESTIIDNLTGMHFSLKITSVRVNATETLKFYSFIGVVKSCVKIEETRKQNELLGIFDTIFDSSRIWIDWKI